MNSPASIIFDINGNPVGVSGSMQLPTGAIGQLLAAPDAGGTVWYLKTISGSLSVTGSLSAVPGGVQTVTGSVSITGQPVTIQGTVTSILTGTVNTNVINQVTVTTTGSLPVTVSGVQNVTGTVAIINPSATAAVTSVASSATNVVLLNANANRQMATVYNDSTQRLYLKLGTTASTTSFTVILTAGSYYELPTPVYRGQIDGIWASANGSARITELT